MSLTQADAEALGWTFEETSERRVEVVDVPVFHAWKAAGGTQQLKTSESERALLADIEQWEAVQPAVPEAPAETPDAVAAELASAAPAEDASETTNTTETTSKGA